MKVHKAVVALLGLLLATLVWAQSSDKVTGQKAEQVRQSIADYIQRDVQLKGGFFVYDPELKRVVGFHFDHVHEGVTRTAEGQYFACVDLRSIRGSLYDLDLYMEETKEGLKPARLVIHKVDGVARTEAGKDK